MPVWHVRRVAGAGACPRQPRHLALVLLLLLSAYQGSATTRHTRTWIVSTSDSGCAGSGEEAQLCKRDNWTSAHTGLKGGAGAATPAIPQIIHQAWFPHTKPIPPKYVEWQRSWAANHPQWAVWLWSDISNRQLVARHYPWYLKFYDSLPTEIMRCDFARPMYMHRYGGLYVDLDTESLRPMDALLKGHHVLLAAIGNDPRHTHSINNGFLASRPQEDFWMFYMQAIVTLFTDKPALEKAVNISGGNRADGLTGPVMLRQVLKEYRELKLVLEGSAAPAVVKVLEPKYLFPNSWMEGLEPKCDLRQPAFNATACKALFPEAYALTYFAHTWE